MEQQQQPAPGRQPARAFAAPQGAPPALAGVGGRSQLPPQHRSQPRAAYAGPLATQRSQPLRPMGTPSREPQEPIPRRAGAPFQRVKPPPVPAPVSVPIAAPMPTPATLGVQQQSKPLPQPAALEAPPAEGTVEQRTEEGNMGPADATATSPASAQAPQEASSIPTEPV